MSTARVNVRVGVAASSVSSRVSRNRTRAAQTKLPRGGSLLGPRPPIARRDSTADPVIESYFAPMALPLLRPGKGRERCR